MAVWFWIRNRAKPQSSRNRQRAQTPGDESFQRWKDFMHYYVSPTVIGIGIKEEGYESKISKC
jgi:hypothetical protein